jgi:hypothetical protein
MGELCTLSLADNDAVLDLEAELGPDVDLGPDSAAEVLIARALRLLVRLWCLPFLAVGWVVVWGAIFVLRGFGRSGRTMKYA